MIHWIRSPLSGRSIRRHNAKIWILTTAWYFFVQRKLAWALTWSWQVLIRWPYQAPAYVPPPILIRTLSGPHIRTAPRIDPYQFWPPHSALVSVVNPHTTAPFFQQDLLLGSCPSIDKVRFSLGKLICSFPLGRNDPPLDLKMSAQDLMTTTRPNAPLRIGSTIANLFGFLSTLLFLCSMGHSTKKLWITLNIEFPNPSPYEFDNGPICVHYASILDRIPAHSIRKFCVLLVVPLVNCILQTMVDCEKKGSITWKSE
jgi:hypothetical protein